MTLGDDKLNALITVGLANNYDLEIARSRVREARAQLGITTASLLPSLEATGEFSRSGRSANGVLPTGASGATFAGVSNLYSAGLDASWEIDIFGGLRNARAGAAAELEAADALLSDTHITLTAEIARGYIAVRAIEKRLAVNRKNQVAQEDSLSLVQSRFAAGLVSELDVAQSQTLVEQTRAQIPALEQLRREQVNALGVLLGKMPVEMEQLLGSNGTHSTEALAQLPPEVPVGLPSEVLRQRPDIRRAERLLAAQNARVGVAIADYFPKFSLTGNFGYLSRSSGSLFERVNQGWGFAPGVSLPLFEGGRISENVAVQRERFSQASSEYQKAVLAAIEESENALSGYVKQRERQKALLRAFEASQKSVTLSKDLYQQGIADFQRVLDAERVSFLAEDELVQSEKATFDALIRSYKSLGGGWQYYLAQAQGSKG